MPSRVLRQPPKERGEPGGLLRMAVLSASSFSNLSTTWWAENLGTSKAQTRQKKKKHWMEAETVDFLDFVCAVSWEVWYEKPRDPFLECSHPTVSPTESVRANWS